MDTLATILSLSSPCIEGIILNITMRLINHYNIIAHHHHSQLLCQFLGLELGEHPPQQRDKAEMFHFFQFSYRH